MNRRFCIMFFLLASLFALNGCDSEPPTLMKASKQFESDEVRDKHIAYMRKNHMDALKHKRDETMYKGIRTKKYSINACIDCHVPESHNGKVLRHTDQEHFCTTCHTYVAAKLDCFECHVDHPVKTQVAEMSKMDSQHRVKMDESDDDELNQLSSMEHQNLVDLAFKYSDNDSAKKAIKSGGVSFLKFNMTKPKPAKDVEANNE